MNWNEWWIELTGRLTVDPTLIPPAKYKWKALIAWEVWPPLPMVSNFVSDCDVESWNPDSYKLLVF